MKESVTDHWLIQFNPKKWDIYSFLAGGGKIESATITKNRNAIAKDARFILWLSGKDGGVIGYGHFTGKTVTPTIEDLAAWKTTPSKSGVHMGIQMEDLFIENPIPRNLLSQDPHFGQAAIFQFPYGGNAFPITESEWNAFESILLQCNPTVSLQNNSARNKTEHMQYLHPIGEIQGVEVGTQYDSREAVRLAKLHRPPMAGISYITDGPAESIVISGGYADDEDNGDSIMYTGQGGQDAPGGKQVKDQEISRGNRALIYSEDHGSPIRIIRGAGGDAKYSPENGYRYDGLYYVKNHWFQKSKQGPLVLKFELEKVSSEIPISLKTFESGLAPSGNAIPGRKSVTTFSVKRDSAVSDWVKKTHSDRCQVCSTTLITRVGTYSTGAHIQALGRPHNGKDETSNMLCLCPNCHVLFDKGVLYIAVDNKTVVNVMDGKKSKLNLEAKHALDSAAIAHHRLQVAGVK